MTNTYPINQPGDSTVLDVPTDILCSYHYFYNIDMGEIHRWGTRIIGDSGAFSAMSLGKPIDREDFHAWAHKWKDALLWTASLDVIGDPDATFANWRAAARDGLELVPTLHYGAEPKEMDRLVDNGASLIGLGGMVPYTSERDRLMRWCLAMHRYARDNHPQVRFHGWGISHPYLLDNLPWWSADSSGFSSCFRFGSLRLWLPRRSRFVSVDLNGRDLARYAKPLRDHYNVDWKLIAESKPDNRRPLGRVALRAVQLYAQWLQKRQIVTAPALLLPKIEAEASPEGPLQVAAQGMAAGAQTYSLTPTGQSVSQFGATGAAVNGPIQVAATVINEPIQNCLGVRESRDVPKVTAGPLSVGAMGSPSMQPLKALSPDGRAINAQGPLIVAADTATAPPQIDPKYAKETE